MNFGKRLKNLRQEKGVSQQELSRRLGYASNSYVFDVERGRFVPSEKKLKQIAKALEVPVAELKDWLLESRLADIGIKDPELVELITGYPQLMLSGRRAVIEAYNTAKAQKRGN